MCAAPPVAPMLQPREPGGSGGSTAGAAPRRHARALSGALGAAALALATLPAQAEVDARSAALGCLTCHAASGAGEPIPPLAGRSAAWLAERMRAYRDGRQEATLMGRIARGYSPRELDAIAEALVRLYDRAGVPTDAPP